MRDISVKESEVLPIILQPLISSAVQAAAGKPSLPSTAQSSRQADSDKGPEAIRKAAPAVEKLRVGHLMTPARLAMLILLCGSISTCIVIPSRAIG